MTQADPQVGGNPRPRQDGPTPAVAALLSLADRHPRATLLARGVAPSHPEAALGERAATLLSLFREALGFLAAEAECPHLSRSLWGQLDALVTAPPLRAPGPHRSASRPGRGPAAEARP